MTRIFKNKYFTLFALIIVPFLFILVLANLTITQSVKGKTYNEVSKIPTNKVGLVLGTAKMLVDGGANPYYTNRIQATIALYSAGKISFVLVSGDNGSIYYNEPNTIKKDLINGGIPAEKIFLDYAGFRTLDSMVRAKYIFGLERVTVISQEFHNERAIYLADKKRLKAIGFNAKGISGKEGIKVQFREYFARVKVFIDLILNTQPRFYGERVEIK
ncbi:SanA/YdcF family protein [Eudoraea chungangensis]|uniref:SanA/YdcF family protein n=1 Tax=Eudoraea chungangensis TaxID=1481905 RepID=UPI0023EBE0E3|nr:ElyC/SanA/YdcF family protein [Eudoraea chungangensis]